MRQDSKHYDDVNRCDFTFQLINLRKTNSKYLPDNYFNPSTEKALNIILTSTNVYKKTIRSYKYA